MGNAFVNKDNLKNIVFCLKENIKNVLMYGNPIMWLTKNIEDVVLRTQTNYTLLTNHILKWLVERFGDKEETELAVKEQVVRLIGCIPMSDIIAGPNGKKLSRLLLCNHLSDEIVCCILHLLSGNRSDILDNMDLRQSLVTCERSLVVYECLQKFVSDESSDDLTFTAALVCDDGDALLRRVADFCIFKKYILVHSDILGGKTRKYYELMHRGLGAGGINSDSITPFNFSHTIIRTLDESNWINISERVLMEPIHIDRLRGYYTNVVYNLKKHNLTALDESVLKTLTFDQSNGIIQYFEKEKKITFFRKLFKSTKFYKFKNDCNFVLALAIHTQKAVWTTS